MYRSNSTHIKNMVCWIGMISVSSFLVLAWLVIPLISEYGELGSGLWFLIHIGDFAEGAHYVSVAAFAIFTGISALLAGLCAIAWIVLTFLRQDMAGILNVCFAGVNVVHYTISAFYYSISDYARVSAGAWIVWVLAGAGLFFAIWALVINVKYRCGYLGRCPGFGREYYSDTAGRGGYGASPYMGNGGYGGGYGGNGGYGGQGGYGGGHGGYANNNGSNQQRGRSNGSIQVISGPYKGSSVIARNEQRVSIGRMQGECTLVIGDAAVSRLHCYVIFHASANMYGVVDVSSSGVFDQNRRPIAKNREVAMAPGARFTIGNATTIQLG